MLRESCSRADNISDVNHCLLGSIEAACVDCIRLDAGCRC